jgi:hypothetical protein
LFTAKHPFTRLIPFAKLEVAVAPELMAPVPVRVRPPEDERPAVATPPEKVEEPVWVEVIVPEVTRLPATSNGAVGLDLPTPILP